MNISQEAHTYTSRSHLCWLPDSWLEQTVVDPDEQNNADGVEDRHGGRWHGHRAAAKLDIAVHDVALVYKHCTHLSVDGPAQQWSQQPISKPKSTKKTSTVDRRPRAHHFQQNIDRKPNRTRT
eukprot:363203-Chlamydomonas_euryale.AAC.36